MTDPAKDTDGDDLDLDLDLDLEAAEPGDATSATSIVAEETTLEPAEAEAVAAAGMADPTQGRWVWQFGAPPPPPSFGSRFFSGTALKELYRFFGCGLMVFVGSLLPWSTKVESEVAAELAAEGDAAAAPTLELIHALVPGYELPIGAIVMMLALWLIYATCGAIYTGRQRIMPIVFMLIPAEASWKRFIEAWGAMGDVGIMDRIAGVFTATGTGVMLTLVGSTVVVLQLFTTIGKVMGKTPEEKEKAAKRAASKDKGGKGKAKKDKTKDKSADGDGDAKGGRKRRR